MIFRLLKSVHHFLHQPIDFGLLPARPMFPVVQSLGSTMGWEAGCDDESTPFCSLSEYIEMVRGIPRPTEAQVYAFVQYFRGAHSWYKKLPSDVPGSPFVFYLDPTAGYLRTISPSGRVKSQKDAKEEVGHYSYRPTLEYQAQFGHLAYGGLWSWDLFKPDVQVPRHLVRFPVFCTSTEARQIPWDVAEAGLAGVTSMVHTDATSPLPRQLKELTAAEVRLDDPPTLKELKEFLRANTVEGGRSYRALRPLLMAESVRVQGEIIKAIFRMLELVYDSPQRIRAERKLSPA